MSMLSRCAVALLLLPATSFSCAAWDDAAGREWVERFSWQPLPVGEGTVRTTKGARLPALRLTGTGDGPQQVRVSVPFAPGALPAGKGLTVNTGMRTVPADVRVLTVHPDTGHSVRRGLVTFVYEPVRGASGEWATLALSDTPPLSGPSLEEGAFSGELGGFLLEVDGEAVRLHRDGALWMTLRPVAPKRAVDAPPVTEVVESGAHFLWVRVFFPDPDWPRVIEARMDSAGRLALRLHVQRVARKDGTAPDLGWALAVEGEGLPEIPSHDFSTGAPFPAPDGLPAAFPDAHLLRRGRVEAKGGAALRYLRCAAEEAVPMQGMAWRTAAIAAGNDPESWNDLLETAPGAAVADPAAFDAIYHCGVSPVLDPPFEQVRRFHQESLANASLPGDDFGNVTGVPAGGVFGMNRLNHCPAIFEDAYRSGDLRLRRTALRWCANFFDLSIWWGSLPQGHFGGTRYNNSVANGDPTHADDKTFMWRSNDAVHFCTKGYDSFFYAWEETGDPRMAAALRHQTAYAAEMVHTDRGECRNIGDVLDFLRLHQFTGHAPWLDQAMRLFRELRTKLGEDDLFSQGGQPIVADGPFIDDDAHGYDAPFAKPYIIGYALQGLPALAALAPDEPRLAGTVRAVARFMAASQDPVGGWRYPHPRSSRMLVDQAMEHAAQLARAATFLEAQGEDITPLLDAVERTLRARVLGYEKTGAILGGVNGWEVSTGALTDGQTIYDLYQKPADRDPARDYTEGAVSAGGSSPDGAVYFSEVLDWYAARRDPARLLDAGQELARVLERAPAAADAARPEDYRRRPDTGVRGHGMAERLPAFWPERLAAMAAFPLRMRPEDAADVDGWRRRGREKVFECLGTPPPAPASFAPVVVAEEDRGAYTARRVVFNVSAWERVPALLLVPKGPGPFPAVLGLHDHGAHFSIGKEKVVRPLADDRKTMKDAEEWVGKCYGGRFFGDALAARGHVVLAVDALFWGERGRAEGVSYEAQQELGANLLQLGMTWTGVVAWDDLRSVDFLATLPEVDPARIAAAGLSMGCHRTWMLCALSDRVAAGAAICWMGTTEALSQPGNNQTRGQSAFSMLVPGLRNWLDYPDVASLACPKPMLFYNGDQDTLFPVKGVEDAWAVLQNAWSLACAPERLETRMWSVPHEFNVEMQEAAFAWLDAQLKR
ncbi:MAG: hypothetical protein GX580_06770 [Candidatus Hydrogenedens sp.]|nr:hypothetical protein [Candidatus Hydrogenedens sp.]